MMILKKWHSLFCTHPRLNIPVSGNSFENLHSLHKTYVRDNLSFHYIRIASFKLQKIRKSEMNVWLVLIYVFLFALRLNTVDKIESRQKLSDQIKRRQFRRNPSKLQPFPLDHRANHYCTQHIHQSQWQMIKGVDKLDAGRKINKETKVKERTQSNKQKAIRTRQH